MAFFRYIIQDQSSSSKNGRIQAADLDGAIRDLQSRGMLILTITEERDQESSAGGGVLDRWFASPPGDRDLLNFSRGLGMLIRGGVPILRALNLLANKSGNPRLNEAVESSARAVASGKSLNTALAAQPQAFSPLMCALVRVGEDSGQLNATLGHFAAYMERSLELKRKILGAVTYPIVVVAFALCIVVFLCLQVVPTFAKIFKSFSVPIPPATKAIVLISVILIDYWPLLLAGAGGAAVALMAWMGTEDGKAAWEKVSLNVPLFGEMFQDAMLEKFFSTFSLLIRSGVSVLSALQNIHAIFAGSPAFARAVDQMSMDISSGKPISAAMRRAGVFPTMDHESVEVAEESGSLPEAMKTLGEFHGERLDLVSRQLATIIEPIMVAVVGGLVGFIMFALFAPMLEMTSIRIR